jgi:hypothetical protein
MVGFTVFTGFVVFAVGTGFRVVGTAVGLGGTYTPRVG